MSTKYKPKHTPQICIMTYYKYLKMKYKIFLKKGIFRGYTNLNSSGLLIRKHEDQQEVA